MAIQEVDTDRLAELLTQGVRVIDVREPAEFEQARLDGSTLIPLGTVPENVEAFRGDVPTYVICRSVCRSMQACKFLDVQGVEVVNVTGGLMAWISSSRDYVSGPA